MKVIRQRDFKDCGVTCLEYIIEYYGGYVPIEKLREDTFTNQNGTTAYHLVETLKKYGFDSYGQKVTMKELEGVIFPCIVHLILNNGMNHFAVLQKVKKDTIFLMDPAYGKRKYSKEEFSGLWDGVILLAIPNSIIPRIPKEKGVLSHIYSFLKKEKKLIFPIVIFSFITSILTIATSLYVKIGIEKINVLERKELWWLISIFGLFTLFKILFEYRKNYLTIYLNKNIEVQYMYSFLTHLFSIPLEKFQTYHEGELITRMEEAKEIKDLFEQICITFLKEIILGITSIGVLFLMNKKLSLIVVLGMALYLLIGLFTSKSFYHLVLKNMEVKERWSETLLENMRLFPTINHLNEKDFQLENLENSFCDTNRETRKIERKALWYQFFKTNFLEILFFLITTYGILLIGSQKLTILDFITFQSLYLYFITPIKELTDIGPKFYYMKGILSKISETMNWKTEELDSKKDYIIWQTTSAT